MEFNPEPVTTPARAAATVVMLRDAPGGMEVFLLKRHGLSDVLGGAYVFPGGKVDALDAELDMQTRLDMTPQALHATLHEPEIDALTAAGLYIAALREAFEESGILFAQSEGGQPVDAARASALLREGHAFDEVLEQLDLRLQASRLLPWSRWITPLVPSMMRKRFDTRFFVSAVPMDQVARHDNHEATESAWLRPRAALEQYRDGGIELAPPQIMSLAHLARHASVQSVLDEARGKVPGLVQPHPVPIEGGRALCYPGDPEHPVRERALPGSTRLIHRNQRFEPAGGFEALFQ